MHKQFVSGVINDMYTALNLNDDVKFAMMLKDIASVMTSYSFNVITGNPIYYHGVPVKDVIDNDDCYCDEEEDEQQSGSNDANDSHNVIHTMYHQGVPIQEIHVAKNENNYDRVYEPVDANVNNNDHYQSHVPVDANNNKVEYDDDKMRRLNEIQDKYRKRIDDSAKEHFRRKTDDLSEADPDYHDKHWERHQLNVMKRLQEAERLGDIERMYVSMGGTVSSKGRGKKSANVAGINMTGNKSCNVMNEASLYNPRFCDKFYEEECARSDQSTCRFNPKNMYQILHKIKYMMYMRGMSIAETRKYINEEHEEKNYSNIVFTTLRKLSKGAKMSEIITTLDINRVIKVGTEILNSLKNVNTVPANKRTKR